VSSIVPPAVCDTFAMIVVLVAEGVMLNALSVELESLREYASLT
jgi:hypothetical protein